jgi:hypothetical protein
MILEPIRALRKSSRRDVLLQQVGLGAVLFMLVAVPGIDVYRTWASLRGEKASWNIKGPPCPVVPKASLAVVGHKPPRTFIYNEVAFTRHLGDVSCSAFREDGFMSAEHYSVCQFSGPGAVTVDGVGRKVTFQPGPGKRTTVTVRDGKISCVVAGWFARRPRGYRMQE